MEKHFGDLNFNDLLGRIPLFSLIGNMIKTFYEDNPGMLDDDTINLGLNSLEYVVKNELEQIDYDILIALYKLFNTEMKEYCLFVIANSANEDIIVGSIMHRMAPYFMDLCNKVSKIPLELTKRNINSIFDDTNIQIFKIFNYDIYDFEAYLNKCGFNVIGKGELEGENVLIVSPLDGQYFVINPNKKGREVIKFDGDGFKGYTFAGNKIYKITKKYDWNADEINDLAEKFVDENPEATLEEFLSSFLSSEFVNELSEKHFGKDIDRPLTDINIGGMISYINGIGFKKEKIKLMIKNEKGNFSNLGLWKTVSEPSKTKNGFYGKDAVVFNVQKSNGIKGTVITNGTESDFFDL